MSDSQDSPRLVNQYGRRYTRAELHRAQSPQSGRGYGGGLMHGGAMNTTTGLGTAADKSESTFFTPTRIYWRSPLEVLYVQSWAARHFVNIPTDDMFIVWRQWMDGDLDGVADTMQDAEIKHHVADRLRKAMRGARCYGTSLLVMVTKEAPLDTPLMPERIREGDLVGLLVYDRFDANVMVRDSDLMSPTGGKPLIYNIYPSRLYGQQPFMVHSSRVLRFDGIEPLTDTGFFNYDDDWAVSELVPVILSIMQDATLASSIAHMSQEASIPVLKIADLRELIASNPRRSKKEASLEDIGNAISQYKSIYRLLLLDKDRDEFNRVAIQFAGLAQLMDKYHARLAAAAQIPETRFMGRAPAGMNATGESDMRNYIMTVEARRANTLQGVLPVLDEVLARDAGLRDVPEFEWRSLLEMSDKEKAEAALARVKALSQALQDGAIDEDEYRAQLDGLEIFGDLPGNAPEPDDDLLLPGPLPGDPPAGPPQPGGGNGE